MRLTAVTLWVVGCFLLLANPLYAASSDLAEKKVVLQISDGGPEKQDLLLNVANNLVKYYGPDRVKIEVVAFGPGLRLLFADNANRDRLQALEASGVRFSACENTITNMAKLLGHPPEINKLAVSVPAGIVRIMELTADEYTLVRP
jgi:hypothetical protein